MTMSSKLGGTRPTVVAERWYVRMLKSIRRATSVRDNVVELQWLDSAGRTVYATPICHVAAPAVTASPKVTAAYDRSNNWARRHGFKFSAVSGDWRRA